MGEQIADESRIRIMHGGPFHAFLGTVGLRLRGRRAFVFFSLGWALPLLLLVVFDRGAGAVLFLKDWGVWARFAIAPVLFTLTEKPISFSIDECTSILFKTPLVASQSRCDAQQALDAARRRTASAGAEGICLIIAAAGSALLAHGLLEAGAPLWALRDGSPTVAAWWCAIVCNTLFWFLLARLIWKHLVWARFLSDLSRCHLRLAITHPDNHAGLGFLGFYPAGYGLFIFAVSSLVAASVGHLLQHDTVTPTLFTAICAIWLIMVGVYFVLPLSGIAAVIARLKRKALLLSLAQAVEFERETEKACLGENLMEDEGEKNESAAGQDVRPIYLASLKTSSLLVNKTNLLQIIAPALAPLLMAGAFFLPYAQLLPVARRLLLL